MHAEKRGPYVEDIQCGDSCEATRICTLNDILLIAGVSADTNRLHLDPAFAAESMFKSPIAHGLFILCILSALFGTVFPGDGTAYKYQNLRFYRPVRIGDTVAVNAVVTGVVPSVVSSRPEMKHYGVVEVSFTAHIGETLVLDGNAGLLVPKRPEQ